MTVSPLFEAYERQWDIVMDLRAEVEADNESTVANPYPNEYEIESIGYNSDPLLIEELRLTAAIPYVAGVFRRAGGRAGGRTDAERYI